MAYILVVDDDPVMRETIAELLTLEGHDTLMAENGYSALNTIRRSIPDLVVTDIYMPEMNGLELIIEMQGSFPDVPVIATSRGGDLCPDNYLDAAHVFGAVHVIEKPFSLSAFIDVVRRALNGSSPQPKKERVSLRGGC